MTLTKQTLAEKIELALIPLIAVVVWFCAPFLPNRLPVGQLLLIVSAIVLFQSLVRDLWLLSKKSQEDQAPKKVARCMCVESSVGATGVIIGAILLCSGIGQLVSINGWFWALIVIAVLSSGFLMKDYVVEWNPWRIRREKDHMNVVFKWKQ